MVSLSSYLIVRKSGYRASARLTKNKPALAANEVAVRLDIKLPDELFERPALKVNIGVKDGDVPNRTIDLETISNLEDIMRNEGFDVKITQIPEEEEKDNDAIQE